jgi:hypothetical protein
MLLLSGLLALAAPVAGAQPQAAAAGPGPAAVEPEPGLDGDEAAEVFARLDSDRDGQLSLEEFRAGLQRPYGSDRPGVVYQRLPARFRALDLDGTSYLEPAEFAVLVGHWRGPGPEPEFATADRDGDGRIDFREFVALLAPREPAPSEPPAPEAAAAAAPAALSR